MAYEKNLNSTDQFLTRSVSNITNAKSTSLVVAPKQGGFNNFVQNDIVFDDTNRDSSKVYLPSKVDRISFVNVYVPVILRFDDFNGNQSATIYKGYYLDKAKFQQELEDSGYFGTGQPFSLADLATAISRLPDPQTFYRVDYGQQVDKTFRGTTVATASPLYYKKMTLLNKFAYDTASKTVSGVTSADIDTKDRAIHWIPNTNELVMSKSLRNGLEEQDDHNIRYYLLGSTTADAIFIATGESLNSITGVGNENILVQVGYYPIADIKVTIDNDNDAQDEKYFNQSGKVIDAVSVSKLITSHTNDSVEGTKIRNARYNDLTSVLSIGQIVRDTNQLYVITQRSIDAQVKNGNEYYNVIYTLSRNRVARSENIIADSSVISYKTPDDNLVFRTQS